MDPSRPVLFIPMTPTERLSACAWWLATATAAIPEDPKIYPPLIEPERVYCAQTRRMEDLPLGPGAPDVLSTRVPVELLADLKQDVVKRRTFTSFLEYLQASTIQPRASPIDTAELAARVGVDPEVLEAADASFSLAPRGFDERHVHILHMLRISLPLHDTASPMSLQCCLKILVRMERAIRIVEADTRSDADELRDWPPGAGALLAKYSDAFGIRLASTPQQLLMHHIMLMTLPGVPRKVHGIMFLGMGGATFHRLRSEFWRKCKQFFFKPSRLDWIVGTETRCVNEGANLFALSALISVERERSEERRAELEIASGAATPERATSPSSTSHERPPVPPPRTAVELARRVLRPRRPTTIAKQSQRFAPTRIPVRA